MSNVHHCNNCKKEVEYKSRGFLYFMFWPWTILMMKKRCATCDSLVETITSHCNNCKKDVAHKDRGFVYFLFWPWTILMMKKRCVTCDSLVETRKS